MDVSGEAEVAETGMWKSGVGLSSSSVLAVLLLPWVVGCSEGDDDDTATPDGSGTPGVTQPVEETDPPETEPQGTEGLTPEPGTQDGTAPEGTGTPGPGETSAPDSPTPVPTPTATPAPDGRPVPGDVIFSEIQYTPRQVADAEGQWIEIVNVTNNKIFDLSGWRLTYQNGSLSSQSLTLSPGVELLFGPGERLVIGNDVSGTSDDAVQPDLNLAFELTPTTGFTLTLVEGVQEMDVVEVDLAFPLIEGHALQLSSISYTGAANNLAANWCASFDSLKGSTDFGSPGEQNDVCDPDVDGDRYWGDDDCDESNPEVNPGAPEIPENLADDDCDEEIDEAPALTPGALVITEIMTNPGAATDEDGEWIEVYNPGSKDVDLFGFEVGMATATHIVRDHVEVEAGSYLLLGPNMDLDDNGNIPVAYEVPGIPLTNDSGAVILRFENYLIDQVTYSAAAGWALEAGASLSLDPGQLDPTANDKVGSWCVGTEPISSSAASPDLGTPGVANTNCPADEDQDGYNVEADCDDTNANVNPGAEEVEANGIDDDCDGRVDEGDAPQDIVITEIMYDPNDEAGAEDVNAEWFEVTNRSDVAVDMNGWTLLDGPPSSTHLIATSLVIQPGEFVVFGISDARASNGDTPVDYVYGATLKLGNNGDRIQLMRPNGTIADEVDYGSGGDWPRGVAGVSIQVTSPTGYNNTLNDLSGNWCNSTVTYGSEGQTGTPGETNRTCTSGPGGGG